MGKIEGTKMYRVVAEGTAPPGLSDEQIKATVINGVSVAGTLLPTLHGIRVEIIDAAAAGGVRRVIS